MAAAKTKVGEDVISLVECCICAETFNDPRVLPCVHTFCRQCLLSTATQSGIIAGSRMPCPICRTEFLVPFHGVQGIPKNFLVSKLIEILKSEQEVCDLCQRSSDWFCKTCSKNLCLTCFQEHLREGMVHEYIYLGNVVRNSMKDRAMVDTSRKFCDDHKGEEFKIFCRACQAAVCTFCFLEKHNTHGWSSLSKAASELKATLQGTRYSAKSFSATVKGMADRSSEEEKRSRITNLERVINKARRDTKAALGKIVDRDATALLSKLQDLKLAEARNIEEKRTEQWHFLSKIDNFEKSCDDVLTQSSTLAVCQTGNELIKEFQQLKAELEELKRQPISQTFSLSFVPTKPEDVRKAFSGNLLGNIEGCNGPASNAATKQ